MILLNLFDCNNMMNDAYNTIILSLENLHYTKYFKYRGTKNLRFGFVSEIGSRFCPFPHFLKYFSIKQR